MNRRVYTARKPATARYRRNSNRVPRMAAFPKGVTHITGEASIHGTQRFLRTFGSINPVRVTLCGLVVGVRWIEDREPVTLGPDLRYHPPFCKNCLRCLP